MVYLMSVHGSNDSASEKGGREAVDVVAQGFGDVPFLFFWGHAAFLQ
jgi:hypothetical protein